MHYFFYFLLINISAFDIESIGLSLDIFLRGKKFSFSNARNVAVKGEIAIK